ncbi:PREDICTED: uncharacterized protein LOC104603329 isoform X2 [Nelumbo nucifera]|uniref:Uncharacterized protein LOC104603329 isoform X2 n=1 Tax=Nelumbo nucifera TaxID=4432 RepID=A0A1U8ARK4_NELNU|nr:PREDICTED: uncharacterized protein LOC104603329 isoform X2 [Nelumbo nucifera]
MICHHAPRDAMALSFPTGGSNSSSANMKVANDASIFNPGTHLLSIPKEKMDQIRSTMMCHEALFKEQVQALHKLYEIQKRAMQETRKRAYSQVQVLTFNSDTVAIPDALHGSTVEEKPLRSTRVSTQAYQEGSHVLSSNPVCSVKEFTGSGPKTSLWIDNTESSTSNSKNKPRIEIDLEKLPEDYLDESDLQVEENNFKIANTTTILSEGTPGAAQFSVVECNPSVIQVESPNLKQGDLKLDLGTFSELRQEIHQVCNQALERKTCGVDINECATGFQPLHRSIVNDFPWNHPAAVGINTVHEEAKLSYNQQTEKPFWLHQGSLALTSRSLSPVHSSRSVEYREQCQGTEKASFGSNLGSIQQHQFLQSNIIFTSANSKLHEQKGSNNRSPVSTNPISFSQGLKTLITLTPIQYDSKKFGSCNQGNSPLESNSNSGKQNSYSSALSSQTSDDSGHENRNTSGHGSNCIGQSADICREGHNNIFTIKGSHSSCFDCSEPDQRNQGTVEGFQSETEGKSQLIKDESQQGPGVVTESNEDTTNEETVEEACESIAAKILLSFAPCRSCGDAKSKVINPLMEA